MTFLGISAVVTKLPMLLLRGQIKPMDFSLIELSIIDCKNKKSYSDERKNRWKFSGVALCFCNL